MRRESLFYGLLMLVGASLILAGAADALVSPPPVENSNDCVGDVHYVEAIGWHLDCSGTCVDQPECEEIEGGTTGAVFYYCGCPGGGTPICCYATLVPSGLTMVPGKNGFCKGESAAAAACAEPPCRLYTPSPNHRKAKCMNLTPIE